MATTKEKTDKKESTKQKETTSKKVSKTWLAILEHKGNGNILDLKAVLK